MTDKILIYGAAGYTGKLFTRHLIEHGYKPVLAARSKKTITIGKELNCESRIFTTENADSYLHDIDILVNLAGPFAKTQNGLINSCIKTGTHYLDIAGEYAEIENAYQFDGQAKKQNVVIIPAAGFGVVPTDIAAKLACERIEHPSHLTIAYATEGGVSRGTMKTVLKDINKPGVIIRNGKSEVALPAMKEFTFKVIDKNFNATYNPWRADLFMAQKSTGVRNIETYSVFPRFVAKMMKGKLLWLRNLLIKRIIRWMPEGPNPRQLKKGKTYVKAIAKNEKGDEYSVEIVGPEAYVFTVECMLNLIEKIKLNQNQFGFISPSTFGKELIETINKVIIRTGDKK